MIYATGICYTFLLGGSLDAHEVNKYSELSSLIVKQSSLRIFPNGITTNKLWLHSCAWISRTVGLKYEYGKPLKVQRRFSPFIKFLPITWLAFYFSSAKSSRPKFYFGVYLGEGFNNLVRKIKVQHGSLTSSTILLVKYNTITVFYR
jgi:hypothetical protein